MDVFSPEERSAVMRRVRGKDTTPELKVRRILREAGIGYRLGGCGLPGRPDLVMKGRRVAVFVHGCFWHGHDCPRGARQPKTNADYWRAKIGRNVARDDRTTDALSQTGWAVITVWECALKRPDFADRLVSAVGAGQATAISGASSTSPADSTN